MKLTIEEQATICHQLQWVKRPNGLSMSYAMLCVAQGKPNSVIAAKLHTTVQVVKNLLGEVYAITGCVNRTELAVLVVKSPRIVQYLNEVLADKKEKDLGRSPKQDYYRRVNRVGLDRRLQNEQQPVATDPAIPIDSDSEVDGTS